MPGKYNPNVARADSVVDLQLIAVLLACIPTRQFALLNAPSALMYATMRALVHRRHAAPSALQSIGLVHAGPGRPATSQAQHWKITS